MAKILSVIVSNASTSKVPAYIINIKSCYGEHNEGRQLQFDSKPYHDVDKDQIQMNGIFHSFELEGLKMLRKAIDDAIVLEESKEKQEANGV